MAKNSFSLNTRFLNVAILFLLAGSVLFFLDAVKGLALTPYYAFSFVVATVFFISSLFGGDKAKSAPPPPVEDRLHQIRARENDLPDLTALPTFDFSLGQRLSQTIEMNRSIEVKESTSEDAPAQRAYDDEDFELRRERIRRLKASMLAELNSAVDSYEDSKLQEQ